MYEPKPLVISVSLEYKFVMDQKQVYNLGKIFWALQTRAEVASGRL